MPYSAEPLPEQPEHKKDPDHPVTLVRLKEYGTVAVLSCALLIPVHDLRYGVVDHKPHTENKEPSTRVDNVRQITTISSSAAFTLVTSFGNWHTPGGST